MITEADYKNGYDFWECRALTNKSSIVSSSTSFYYVCCPTGWTEDVVGNELKLMDKSIKYVAICKKMDYIPRNQNIFKMTTSVYMRNKKIDVILDEIIL